MSKMRWFDCNGVELHDGDIIRDVDSGEQETVYACHPVGRPDEESLGVNASNEVWLKLHPDRCREVYPFSNFASRIVNGERRLTSFEKVV